MNFSMESNYPRGNQNSRLLKLHGTFQRQTIECDGENEANQNQITTGTNQKQRNALIENQQWTEKKITKNTHKKKLLKAIAIYRNWCRQFSLE